MDNKNYLEGLDLERGLTTIEVANELCAKLTSNKELVLGDAELISDLSTFVASHHFDFADEAAQKVLLCLTNFSKSDAIYYALLNVKHADYTLLSPARASVNDFYLDFQYALFVSRGNKDALRSLISVNITYPPFCELEFTKLMARGNYQKAVSNMEKMIAANKDAVWFKNSWNEQLLEAKRALANKN